MTLNIIRSSLNYSGNRLFDGHEIDSKFIGPHPIERRVLGVIYDISSVGRSYTHPADAQYALESHAIYLLGTTSEPQLNITIVEPVASDTKLILTSQGGGVFPYALKILLRPGARMDIFCQPNITIQGAYIIFSIVDLIEILQFV